MSTWSGQCLEALEEVDGHHVPLLDRPIASPRVDSAPPPPSHIRRKPVPLPQATTSALSNAASNLRATARLQTSAYTPLRDDVIHGVAEVNQNPSEEIEEPSPLDPTRQDELRLRRSAADWLPYTLRWQYLVFMLIFSLAVLATVIVLHVESHNHDGLGPDDGKSILFFGWRFVPTLVAVLYALMCTMLLEDTKRTEPYARLAKPDGSNAQGTILQSSGAWWNALADGFSRTKNNGSRSWALICSSTCMALATIVISPLSSAFILSEDVIISTTINFHRAELSSQSPLAFGDQIIPRFRTISHMLQNVTTSAWVTDNYAVLPFWPVEMSAPPLGAVLKVSSESWHAPTTVFRTNLTCQPLHLVSKQWENLTHYGDDEIWPGGSVSLSSDDGCTISYLLDNSVSTITDGGMSWANQRDLYAFPNVTYSQQCSGSDIILMTTPWVINSSMIQVEWLPDLQVLGQICNANYEVAEITVSVNLTNTDSVVTFKEDDFANAKRSTDFQGINVNQFEENFLTANWSYHLVDSAPLTHRPYSEGPSIVLSAMYNFSMTDAVNSDTFVDQAVKLKQRFLGENLVTYFSRRNAPVSTNVAGQQVSAEQRIIVVPGIAFALEVSILVEVILVVTILWLTRLERRRLEIDADPANTTMVAKLMTGDTGTRQLFKFSNDQSSVNAEEDLKSKIFWIISSRLFASNQKKSESSSSKNNKQKPAKSKSHDWRPVVIRRRAVSGLALLILATLVAIAILYDFSSGPGLYQKAFVYETQLVVSNKHISTIAPYSIIPTLIAVTIGLWWSALETQLRLLQPFISMAQRSVTFAKGVNLSYQSSYLVWAALRAGSNKHWLLSIVCTGAFLSQIFTISMSALWQVDTGHRNSSHAIQRSLELRSIPLLSTSYADEGSHAGSSADTGAIVLSTLYGSLHTNWLYSAMNQLTFNGTAPAWSLDGWSFVPIDLSQLNLDRLTNTTVTMITPATRAQLSCTPYESLSNLSDWLVFRDFTNTSVWNVTANPAGLTTGYTLGCGGLAGPMVVEPDSSGDSICSYKTYTTFLAHEYGVTCCDNSTAGSPGDAAIAYWSANTYFVDSDPSSDWNFTAKWIYGRPVAGLQVANVTDRSYLAWPEAPQAVALNCKPIIQQANATVTVRPDDGQVVSYSIMGDVQSDQNAWTQDFVIRQAPDAYGTQNVNVTTSHGILFLKALLGASDITGLNYQYEYSSYDITPDNENLDDLTFNIRLPGVNMDYMSYAMFSRVGQDTKALLDVDALYFYANLTFSTFFQHYVSSNVSMQTGGWAYQSIGATLPADLATSMVSPLSNGTAWNTNRTVEVTVSSQLKLLHMSPLAAWLCMSLLLWLTITAFLFIVVEKRYLGPMVKGVATLADVATLVAGSTALLSHIQNEGSGNHEAAGLKTRLGWFKGEDGQDRWGIELVGEEHGVEWLKPGEEQVQIKRGAEEQDADVESVPMIAIVKSATVSQRDSNWPLQTADSDR